MLSFEASISDPPIGPLIISQLIKPKHIVKIKWGKQTTFGEKCLPNLSNIDDLDIETQICTFIAKNAPEFNLLGKTLEENLEVNHWLSFAIGPLRNDYSNSFKYLNSELSTQTFLVGHKVTVADIFLWSVLHRCKHWIDIPKESNPFINISRWYSFIENESYVKEGLQSVVKKNQVKNEDNNYLPASNTNRKQEGKYLELAEAEMGKVVVRFPPEASGYLHIGHGKAAFLNDYYKRVYNGKLILRFDDTNPAKERSHFEKAILEDMQLLDIKADMLTYTSDHFELLLKYCEQLLKEGNAYVDDTDPDVMKHEREQHIQSKNRNNDVNKNMSMWKEMKNGTEYGQKCCVRAKIDMDSKNGCLRDPTIYRCKKEPHPRTGDKYHVYPTYDFACPIVDSYEGVTHSLRTTEYGDRDAQFNWFIDVLKLRRPLIWEYSRLNMNYTVLSKRRLTWFVDEGLVDGWDDPRFPTIRGMLRRGLTVEGLRTFIESLGSSRSVVSMEWDKIWTLNKKVIDPIATRYTALECEKTIPVFIKDAKKECIKILKHPKGNNLGERNIWKGPRVLIDYADAELIKEGENVTFIHWGNIKINKINRNGNEITSIEGNTNLSNTDYKKTLKVTWLADLKEEAPHTPCICVYFDHIITKAVLGKDEDFKNFVNKNTKLEKVMLGESGLRDVRKSEIIQLQRKGFYICDNPYEPHSIYTGRESPIILFYIPDGHTKESLITSEISKLKGALKEDKKVENTCIKQSMDNSNLDLEKVRNIHENIIKQGDKIRDLKTAKAQKEVITKEVKVLLDLKEKFKELSKIDWMPGFDINGLAKSTDSSTLNKLKENSAKSVVENVKNKGGLEIHEKIVEQGNKIRKLKENKEPSDIVKSEVQILLSLKNDYEKVTGQKWVPEANAQPKLVKEKVEIVKNVKNEGGLEIHEKIVEQGNKIRKLKENKEPSDIVKSEVQILLSLKNEYEKVTGQKWVPEANAQPKLIKEKVEIVKNVKNEGGLEIHEKIVEQGNKIRKLKENKEPSDIVKSEVQILLSLKNEYEKVTGQKWVPEANAQPKSVKEKENVKRKTKTKEEIEKEKEENKQLKKKEQMQSKHQSAQHEKLHKIKTEPKKQTRLGLEAEKEVDLSDWYSQVITKGEMIEYYDVSGCYILRPWAYAIWEQIQSWLDGKIKELGVRNCYFPIFVSKSVLEREKNHIEDFAPEVAWVTKSGDTELAEHIAIRPTSETVMYPAYAKWIQSHRDLPLKLNQWNNVVRWEFKHPQPFLRTREFLWQEGHTAYANKEDAIEEVYRILDLYENIYTDLLAIPVVKGRKTEKEKFAGGDFTTTVEAFVSASGRGIQGATSHHLGQNFSKMFDIMFEDPETQEKVYVYQNSWGLTTRTIGVMIMVHSDNKGLVLPPRVATLQVIIVPCGIGVSTSEDEKKELQQSCDELERLLKASGIRVEGDYRDNYSPGWKFNHWELKGVPIRAEIGPKDLKLGEVVMVRRDNGHKITFKKETIVESTKTLLDDIHNTLLKNAVQDLQTHIVRCDVWEEFTPILDTKNLILSPFCGQMDCEDRIKEESKRADTTGDVGTASMGAKSLCIPFQQPSPGLKDNQKCIHPSCTEKAQFYALFGRSY